MPPGATTRRASSTRATFPARSVRSTHPARTTQPRLPWSRARRWSTTSEKHDLDRAVPDVEGGVGRPDDRTPGVDTLDGRPTAGQRGQEGAVPQLTHHHRQTGATGRPLRSGGHPGRQVDDGQVDGRRLEAQRVAGGLEQVHPGRQELDGVAHGDPEHGQGVGRQRPDLFGGPVGVLGELLGHRRDHVAQDPLTGLGAPAPLPQIRRQSGPAGRAARPFVRLDEATGRRRRRPTAGSPGVAAGRNPRAVRARRPTARPGDRSARPPRRPASRRPQPSLPPPSRT